MILDSRPAADGAMSPEEAAAIVAFAGGRMLLLVMGDTGGDLLLLLTASEGEIGPGAGEDPLSQPVLDLGEVRKPNTEEGGRAHRERGLSPGQRIIRHPVSLRGDWGRSRSGWMGLAGGQWDRSSDVDPNGPARGWGRGDASVACGSGG